MRILWDTVVDSLRRESKAMELVVSMDEIFSETRSE